MVLKKTKVDLHTSENNLYKLISEFDYYCGEYIESCDKCDLIKFLCRGYQWNFQ